MENVIIGTFAIALLLCVAGVIVSLLIRNDRLRRLIDKQRKELNNLRRENRSLKSDLEGTSIH
jgi:cell division protein FtsB